MLKIAVFAPMPMARIAMAMVAQILNKVLNPVHATRVATLYFASLDPAHFDQCSAPSFLWLYALSDIFLGFSANVIPQLFV
jgi:hypothetical protein